jgi:hypothetical protein
MSQPLIYQRVRPCANLFWSDLDSKLVWERATVDSLLDAAGDRSL